MEQVRNSCSRKFGCDRPPKIFLWPISHKLTLIRVCTRVSIYLYFEVPLNYDILKLENILTKVWPNDVATLAKCNFFLYFRNFMILFQVSKILIFLLFRFHDGEEDFIGGGGFGDPVQQQ